MATSNDEFNLKVKSPGYELTNPTLQAAQGGLISASTDQQLINAWLSRSGLSAKTVRNARKEVERFLIWCGARGLGLRDVRFEDLAAYSDFIANPHPDWVSKTQWPKDDPAWRPFAGALAETSQRQAMTFIKGMYNWGQAAEYFRSNPAKLLGRMSPPKQETVERYLARTGIAMMLESCNRMPTEKIEQMLRRARARFLVKLLYMTGARLGEVVKANMGSIRKDDNGLTWFHVIGKGKKAGKIPVPDDLAAEFKRYRKAFGLPPATTPGDPAPMMMTTRGALRRATSNALYNAIEVTLRGAAQIAHEMDDPAMEERLKSASPHWLRHSCFTHQIEDGVPLKTVQKNARHSSMATTALYIHKEDEARHAETIKASRVPAL